MKRLLIMLPIVLGALVMSVSTADADNPYKYGHWNRAARFYNAYSSWHMPYAHAEWGRPVALIVPPNVNMQTDYAWGVGRNRMTPINYQFARPYANPTAASPLYPAPTWPYDTQQVGVYYVRGPW
mgnify:CR=1 FL=1